MFGQLVVLFRVGLFTCGVACLPGRVVEQVVFDFYFQLLRFRFYIFYFHDNFLFDRVIT